MAFPLPHDLLVRIVAHFDPLSKYDLQDLRPLCFVSKAWLRAAQPRFWSVVAIYDLRQQPPPKPVSSYRWEKDPIHRRRKDKDVVAEAAQARGKLLEQHGYSATEVADEIIKLRKELLDLDDYDEHDWEREWSASDIVNSSTHHQLTPAEENPHLARLVRRFVFFGQYEGRTASRAVERGLAVCTNVEAVELVYPTPTSWRRERILWDRWQEEHDDELRWRYPPPFLAAPALKSQASLLRSLTLTNFLDSNLKDLLTSISTFSHLEHLSLASNNDRHDSQYFHGCPPPFSHADVPPPSYRLERLEIGGVLPQTLVDILVSGHHSTLTSLTLAVRNYPIRLDPRLSRLSHLILIFGQPKGVIGTLELAPSSLRHLEFRWWHDMNRHGAGGLALPSILDAIPSTVTRLSFPYYFNLDGATIDWDHLLDALKERSKRGKKGVPTWLPSLKALDVADYTVQSERYERVRALYQYNRIEENRRLAQGKTAVPVPRDQAKARTRRNRLQQECDKRGIWLSPLWREWTEHKDIDEGKRMRSC
ncbi:hypothetical protein JCM6882_008608 [Rhodosporidiobolus microsporus]